MHSQMARSCSSVTSPKGPGLQRPCNFVAAELKNAVSAPTGSLDIDSLPKPVRRLQGCNPSRQLRSMVSLFHESRPSFIGLWQARRNRAGKRAGVGKAAGWSCLLRRGDAGAYPFKTSRVLPPLQIPTLRQSPGNSARSKPRAVPNPRFKRFAQHTPSPVRWSRISHD